MVSVMGAQQLPRRFHGDPITVTIDRMADSYSAYWMFGRDVSTEVTAASIWARLSTVSMIGDGDVGCRLKDIAA